MANIQKIIKRIDKDILQLICFSHRIDYSPQDKKSELLDKILKEIRVAGISKVLSFMKKKPLVTLAESFQIETKHTHDYLVKMITRTLNEDLKAGLKKAPDNSLISMLNSLNIDKEDIPEKRTELLETLFSEIEIVGFEVVLSNLPLEALKLVCTKMDLTVDSSSKNIIIDSLLNESDYHPEKQEKSSVTSKTKPPLQKGISKRDLDAWYLRSELQDFCREHKIHPFTGRKSQIISKILAYLNGTLEEEETKSKLRSHRKRKAKARQSQVPKKRRRMSSKKSKTEESDKEVSKKKDQEKTKPTKKEEKRESSKKDDKKKAQLKREQAKKPKSRV